MENSQIGVFLALYTARDRAPIDQALYLPQAWCDDKARTAEAGVPTDVTFATKPQLAMTMLKRAFEAGLRPSFVLADSVYGSDSKFRRFLKARGQPFVVAVTSQQRFWVCFEQRRVDAIAADLPERSWFRMSVGEGTRGPRVYDWASVKFGFPTDSGMERHLLVRCHIDTGEVAYFLCAALAGTQARDLTVAAGHRWAIECCFESAKQETGLDEYEVRSWAGWHRHVTLSLLAMMFLTAVRLTATEPKPRRSKRSAVIA
ncbi:MAG: IS701 family transposase [Tepidisphaeraceae bacterium]